MADLSSAYLGLALKNPLIPSSSPLTGDLDGARRLEDAGAAAIVLPSLFEETILAEEARMTRFLDDQGIGHGEADSFRPLPARFQGTEETYLNRLRQLKEALAIPVIASLNGTTDGGWLSHATSLAEAGADALELNIYYLAADPLATAAAVEARYLAVAEKLVASVDLPVAVKLSPQFTAPLDLVRALERVGVRGVALFNRFYQPDIDLETLEVVPRLALSTPEEALLRIRWTAMLRGHTRCAIAVTGGFHSADDALKALLAGADVVHLCSVLLREGPAALAAMLVALRCWLEEREYESVDQLKGSLSCQHAPDPAAYARANYVQVLENYSVPSGVRF
ncbi:dihydroorotate dehydrogenase-like protein [Pseudohaliea rubra]|uniref:Putative dihydropyrimidine dehydrogenase [NADP+], similar to dihydroorotate dehydrogenase n=1 Tax=Pseudohaliea rubra DSM 19751 TaxID=1265313 RepID=A0A095WWI3_9GAMM|nr:dihydroorotate dehydrogenase-like protein [Pseudohaliea rubra]KGE03004.1 putative dihydropyrimidine dehydrogenase [NADP+], similar to dihydroorotate dehydrogenase [Pseudohaliea rubra DSM 19751]